MRVVLLVLAAIVLAALLKPDYATRLSRQVSYAFAGKQPALPEAPAGQDTLAQAEPLRITINGRDHKIRLDALLRYGASPAESLCAGQPIEADGDGAGRSGSCGKGMAGIPQGDAALMEAAILLSEAGSRPLAEREDRLRDANGLILLGLRSGAFRNAPMIPAVVYERLADQAADGRLHDVAAELWLAMAAFCPDGNEACRSEKVRDAGKSLVAAGRWFNDAGRLRRAAELLEGLLGPGAPPLEPRERFSLRNDIGNAYSYASPFAQGEERLALMEWAIAAYEPELAYAEEHAPSFNSAKLWQNLGAAYVDRGVMTGDRRDLDRGIVLYEKSLQFFDRTRYRQSWARSKSNMGAVRSRMALAGNDLALHDTALRDHADSIAAFEEGKEQLDVAYSRYRLALSLSQKVQSIAALAKGLTAEQGERRGELDGLALESRKEALRQLDAAGEAFRRSGSQDYLARVERLSGEIRRALPGP